ncbi:hypothetical protein V6Z11_D06G134800 [Gossypium hirsutum]
MAFNYTYTKILFTSLNVPVAVVQDIANCSQLSHCIDLGRYLSLPLHFGRVTKYTYAHLLDKVKKCLASWKANQLSLARKAVLDLDRLNRNFLWGSSFEKKKVPLVKWETVCQEKSNGGMGIHCSASMNTTLLAKLGWELENGDSALWAHVLRSKYLNGDGAATSFWCDRWLVNGSIMENFEVVVSLEFHHLTVKDVVMDTSERNPNFWTASSYGNFSVSFAYELLMFNAPVNGFWMKIWKLDVPHRIRFFLWLVTHDHLLTKAMCVRRNITGDATCPRCGCHEETPLHSHHLRGGRLVRFNSCNLTEWLRANCSNKSFLVENSVAWSQYFAFTCWLIWWWRNKTMFVADFMWPGNASHLIATSIGNFNSHKVNLQHRVNSLIAWSRLPLGFVKMNLRYGHITKTELYAIYNGLCLAWEHGIRNLVIESNSLVAINKILIPLQQHDPFSLVI